MKYKLYKLDFKTAVHFGNGSLNDSGNTFAADRLFSALCIEALNKSQDELNSLYNAAANGKLIFSDSMPYIDDTYYIPKPIMHINRDTESSSTVKKAFKKLDYIPADKIDTYISGRLDPKAENEKLDKLGMSDLKTSAAVRTEDGDALPYRVGTFSFNKNCGLYFIAGFENDDIFYAFDDLMYSLGYSGIGGKISSGLGKFIAASYEVPQYMLERLNGSFERYITLSVAMAKDNELEKALDGAEYMLIKRSGFISSQTYADTFRKKKELYCFKAGSCFSHKFDGDIFDLSEGGNHPVYRYAKPLMMGVDINE